MRENTLFKFGVTSLISVFAFTSSVVAQVDEIIVSAQKRDQALVDTPVSVAVITSKDLELTEANDLSLRHPAQSCTRKTKKVAG